MPKLPWLMVAHVAILAVGGFRLRLLRTFRPFLSWPELASMARLVCALTRFACRTAAARGRAWHPPSRCNRAAWAALATLLVLAVTPAAWAQQRGAFFPLDAPFQRVELSSEVSVPEADAEARAHLQQAMEYLAASQWDEGIETLRRLMAEDGTALLAVRGIPLGDAHATRYVPLQQHVQRLFAALPPEALELYRRRVDPLAERMYQTAVANRDAAALQRLLDEFFASSVGDDALLAAGELALEAGDPAAARAAWLRLLPVPDAAWDAIDADTFEEIRNRAPLRPGEAQLLDDWYRRDQQGPVAIYRLREEPRPADVTQALKRLWTAHGWLQLTFYPDPGIPAAEVAARLVLASLVEGTLDRAEAELERFRQQYPEATGRLAAREGNLAEILSDLLAESREWISPSLSRDWLTFARNPQRDAVARGNIDISGVAWQVRLPKVTLPDPEIATRLDLRPRRVAEDVRALLSYHPAVAGQQVFFATEHQVFGFNLSTGKSLWAAGSGRPAGEIYRTATIERPGARLQSTLGVPRFTVTVHGNRLYARVGSPLTAHISTRRLPLRGENHLICLDLSAQGALLWEYTPETAEWSLEGAPLSDGARVYVALRRSGIRSHAHVGCFDADSGQLLWRTPICSAATPGAGAVDEATHNLLTLHRGTLYYNTNLGAVAALDTADGKIRWLARYRRAEPTSPLDPNEKPAHYYRDLNPAVYHQGRLFVAPADTPAILALDATTGMLLWESAHRGDAVHLLGVAGGRLIASGDKVYGFDIQGGRLEYEYPAENHLPNGFGRGVLVDGTIYWPTREEIFVLDAASGAPVRQPIRLDLRQAQGGNLVVAGGYLLIAGSETLWAFRLPEGK